MACDLGLRANRQITISTALRPFAAVRVISPAVCCNDSSTLSPPSVCRSTSARLAFSSFFGIALSRARNFSGSIANWGNAATRNRLALSFIETTAPRHARRSRTSGVSSTSMFSMERGIPCTASSVATWSRCKCWRYSTAKSLHRQWLFRCCSRRVLTKSEDSTCLAVRRTALTGKVCCSVPARTEASSRAESRGVRR